MEKKNTLIKAHHSCLQLLSFSVFFPPFLHVIADMCDADDGDKPRRRRGGEGREGWETREQEEVLESRESNYL